MVLVKQLAAPFWHRLVLSLDAPAWCRLARALVAPGVWWRPAAAPRPRHSSIWGPGSGILPGEGGLARGWSRHGRYPHWAPDLPFNPTLNLGQTGLDIFVITELRQVGKVGQVIR